jgi:hypothetical protein
MEKRRRRRVRRPILQGRPLQLVQVGDPAPRSVDEAARGSVLMYVCSVHGDDGSPRPAQSHHDPQPTDNGT